MRAAIPDTVDLAVDFHGRVGPAMAIRLAAALADCHLLFIEEPVLPENVDALVAVARSTTIPIATGERLFTRWGFREVLEKGAAAVLQPDLCHAGGIGEVRKIAAMAEVYYAAIAPHNPLGPISLAAGLQVDACIPNFLCQEQVSLGEGYLRAAVRPARRVHRSAQPGQAWGSNWTTLQSPPSPTTGSWQTPILYHQDDGSFGDW